VYVSSCVFIQDGFDTLESLACVDRGDLDHMQIKTGHKRLLLRRIDAVKETQRRRKENDERLKHEQVCGVFECTWLALHRDNRMCEVHMCVK